MELPVWVSVRSVESRARGTLPAACERPLSHVTRGVLPPLTRAGVMGAEVTASLMFQRAVLSSLVGFGCLCLLSIFPTRE